MAVAGSKPKDAVQERVLQELGLHVLALTAGAIDLYAQAVDAMLTGDQAAADATLHRCMQELLKAEKTRSVWSANLKREAGPACPTRTAVLKTSVRAARPPTWTRSRGSRVNP